MRLVERAAQLDQLRSAAASARATRSGHVVFVVGEAGAGKTALIGEFAATHASGPLLVGACDNLAASPPCAPIHDWARTQPRLAAALRDTPRGRDVGEAVLATLTDSATIGVIEDVHWADDATLDLLLHVGRRVSQTPSLLVLTFREDEATPGSPLGMLAGDLATSRPVRVAVPPLSRAGVTELAADADLDADALWERTGGNAFYVTECLFTGDQVPAAARRHRVPLEAARRPGARRSASALGESRRDGAVARPRHGRR